jgi:hypothetical protein
MLLIIQQASVNGFDEYETIWNADIFKCLTSLVSMVSFTLILSLIAPVASLFADITMVLGSEYE